MNCHHSVALPDFIVGVEQAAEGQQGSCDQNRIYNAVCFKQGNLPSSWMLGDEASKERYYNKSTDTPIYRNSVVTDLLEVPADAVPEDALGVDGADEELPHKLPMAHTERDISDRGEDSNCGSKLVVVVIQKEDVLDSPSKCRSSKEEAEGDQMSLWVFNLFVAHIGKGGCAD